MPKGDLSRDARSAGSPTPAVPEISAAHFSRTGKLWDVGGFSLEDTKEFLASFEQVPKLADGLGTNGRLHLLPALSGESGRGFRGLEAREQRTMRREARQHFRHCQVVEDPRRIHSQLQELCCQWLKPEKNTKEQILELLILEQFLASLPPELRGWIQARRPESCSQAVALVEDFLMSQQEAKTRISQSKTGETQTLT
uniref:SCAN box domain-containing protein n=1 Tax=Laticauda laticaudata TaxID=8630 RepID=A0A8C5S1H4_LATLA